MSTWFIIKSCISTFVVYLFLLSAVGTAYRKKSVYQRITSEDQFSNFNYLVLNSSLAQRAILFWNTTVFVPRNEAFQKFNGFFSNDLVYYHVGSELKSTKNIFESTSLHTLADGFPPLWVSKIDGNIYINNAMIVMNDSDYFSRDPEGTYNHNQVLHVIDDVLEPPSIYLDSPTALDLIYNFTTNKHLPTSKYYKRINDLKLSKLFKSNGGNTYFVPLDGGFDNYRYRMTDKYIVEGHIISNQVLFTRPTVRNFYFKTKSNGDYIYILVSFVDRDGKVYIRSNTILGDSNHQKGELLSEVVRPNVPVKNGVVHFIAQPLGIFDMQLKLFPYLPILNKLSGDPELNITFQLGRKTNFNEHLRNTHSLLTFFVPRDKAWRGFEDNLTEITEESVKLLGRHLVISDVRFTMQMLWYKSFDRVITLNTVGGPIDVKVTKDDNEDYIIIYDNRKIKVYRPDYLCTNGIIHIIEEPFIASGSDKSAQKLKMDFWKSLEDFVF